MTGRAQGTYLSKLDNVDYSSPFSFQGHWVLFNLDRGSQNGWLNKYRNLVLGYCRGFGFCPYPRNLCCKSASLIGEQHFQLGDSLLIESKTLLGIYKLTASHHQRRCVHPPVCILLRQQGPWMRGPALPCLHRD